jgi:uncharacterized radical SAM superfamily Fe-S cluster-containing enzyme
MYLLRDIFEYTDVLKLVEEKTNGEISCNAWYPISSVVPTSRFLSAMRKVPIPECKVRQHCGAGTYLFFERGGLIPITNFVDVESFLEFIEKITQEINGGGNRVQILAKVILQIPRYIDDKNGPKSINVVRMILDLLKTGNRERTARFHRTTLFLGIMHFQDLYNIDLERVKQCRVHYTTPDSRMIPSCTYNIFHRDFVELKVSEIQLEF